jgi:hypothetical protein
VVTGFEVIIREDNYWMGIALREARKAADRGEVTIGALVVRDGAGRKSRDILKTLTTYPFCPFKLNKLTRCNHYTII